MIIDLSSCLAIDPYAFINCEKLMAVSLNENGTDVGEGAFGYCLALQTIKNLDKVEKIDEYAFAFSGIKEIDLSGAVTVGDFAFMKENKTDITLTLGEKLVTLGDNPFAMCNVKAFSKEISEEFNGVTYTETTYTYDISETVKIINGSIYCVVPSGLELITYCENGERIVEVPEGTVRITAMAFAGSGVERVKLPHSLDAIGHKAFYDCHSLKTVIFQSYEAPILEEEFDQNYYESFDNLPATGEYEFTDYEKNTLKKQGLGIVPYYMWNVSDGKYSNASYGANFVNRIGHGNPELIMVRPSNGQYYETFIYSQYFTMVIDGAVAMDDITLDAIEAINSIPEKVQLTHEALVIFAREAYNKIATKEQQALVDNYSALVSAENRILALKSQNVTPDTPDVEEPDDNDVVAPKKNVGLIVAVVILSLTTIVNAVVAVAVGTLLVVSAIKGVSVINLFKKKSSPVSGEVATIKVEKLDVEKKTEVENAPKAEEKTEEEK
jgi:hypothetical protein